MITLALITGGREYVLSQLANDPLWHKMRLKTPTTAAERLVGIAHDVAIEELRALIANELPLVYHEYAMKNGERIEATAGDWDEGLDDQINELFGQYNTVLSGSWIGQNTIDTRLHEKGEIERLSRSFAAEAWKMLTYERTAKQILAGVGIVSSDLAAFELPTTTQPPAPEFDQMSINAILNKIMLFMPDEDSLTDMLDQVSDDDMPLAQTAAGQLGLGDDDIPVLQAARAASSAAREAWYNAIIGGELLDEAKVYVDLDPVPSPPPPPPPSRAANANVPPPPGKPAGGVPPPPRATVPPPPVSSAGGAPSPTAPARRGRKPNAETAPEGTITAEWLALIKDNGGFKDETLADILGVSRPSLNNYLKGKGWCVPEQSRRAALKATLEDRIARMTSAVNVL